MKNQPDIAMKLGTRKAQ